MGMDTRAYRRLGTKRRQVESSTHVEAAGERLKEDTGSTSWHMHSYTHTYAHQMPPWGALFFSLFFNSLLEILLFFSILSI
jgi:hypothetical protein